MADTRSPSTTEVPTPGSTAPAVPAASARLSHRTVMIIGTLIVATFIVVLNETILNVALTTLMTDLSVSAPTVQWLTTGYLLTMAVVIPTTGSILQKLSTQAAFLLAMGLFCSGTALAAASPGFALLLTARIIQAGGTAIMLPLLMTTILTLVPQTRRGAVIGNVSIALSVAPAMGPTVSGLILEYFTWRFLFVFILPIALISLTIGAKHLTTTDTTTTTDATVAPPRAQGRPRARIDVLSVILTVPGFGGLVYGLSSINGAHTQSVGPAMVAMVSLLIAVACLTLFTLRQVHLQKTKTPILDLRVFATRMFTVSVLLMIVATTSLFAGVILLPIYLQDVRGLGTLNTGLTLLPGGLVMGLLAPLIGRLFDKIGPLPLTLTGSILIVLTLWQFSLLTDTTPLTWIIATHIILSLGLSLVLTPTYTAGLNPLPPHLYAHGSAIISTAQQIAGAAGTALLVGVFATTAATTNTTNGMTTAFTTATLIALITTILASITRKTRELPRDAATPVQA